MRARNIKKNFWLNEEEDNLLKEKCQIANTSEAQFFRDVITGYKIKEQPKQEFYEVLKNLRGIAINMNQVARKANALNYVDVKSYKKAVEQVSNFILELKQKFLIKEKTNVS